MLANVTQMVSLPLLTFHSLSTTGCFLFWLGVIVGVVEGGVGEVVVLCVWGCAARGYLVGWHELSDMSYDMALSCIV